MSREPIIVDEVDVSGRVYRAEEKCVLKDDGCCFFPNCDYKNWQRKEQECEFWKKELDKTHLLMLKRQDELVKEILKNDQLKAESEEYKQALQEVKNLASCGKDMYMERGKYENYEAMAEWMKNQFYFILQKCEVLKDE